MKVDRLAQDVAITPELLATNFTKTAFGEEFVFVDGQITPADPTQPGSLRKWTGPIRYSVMDSANDDDRAHIAALADRLLLRTGLSILPAEDGQPNMFVRILSKSDRARIRQAYLAASERSPLAELFLAWSATRDWECAAEIYLSDASDASQSQIILAMIYIRDEVKGLPRQACIEEEISQSLGLVRDDPTVRPSIFNDDEEFALLTRHDELLLQILYDPSLKAGMTKAAAKPIVQRLAHAVIEP
ncbi:MAG: DUF2927 domain-containing protein [Paracoccaceae bacterium]